ncbi:MAG: 23S rRNA pseudouridine synthase [Parcubacteria group bacterium Athens1014_10]|nr:MAG: 23S rRNA pseudouridine synthase [Parcubacteria group bacterium Athens1014_10]TSD05901.1 MAG: 23S rRNA pseudouridine synthase [Parcubacteria group bacterium Athens0714_12]
MFLKHTTNKENCQKQRLDKFLAEKFFLPRAFIQELIKSNGVLVNDKKIKAHYLLKENEEIKIDEKKIEEMKKAKEIDLSPSKKKLEIIFEDKNFLIINKPAGLIVHPSAAHRKETLVNILLNYFPEIKNVGEDEFRPGIVHRLDKEASGLLAIAKTQKAFEYLKKQFQDRQIEKEYLVLVHGRIKEKKGKIELPIGRLPKKGFKMSTGYFSKAKPALTEYELIKYINDYSFLKVKTKTGRTHQIRVHLKALGYPVVGDKIYKPKKSKKVKLDRIFLHCHKLGFHDLENKKQNFEIGLPDELNDFFKSD